MLVRFGLLLAFAVGALPATAQENALQPDASAVFERDIYQAVVGEVFYRDSAVCRGGVQMITIPSFTPERSVGTCRKEGQYVAFAAVPRLSLYYTGMDTTGVEPWSPERARAVEIDRAEVRIDSAIAARIEAVWARALHTVRPPAPATVFGAGTDGEILHFASFSPGMLTAHAWSPSPDSLPGAMWSLGKAIDAVAHGRAPVGVLGLACDRVERLLAAPAAP